MKEFHAVLGFGLKVQVGIRVLGLAFKVWGLGLNIVRRKLAATSNLLSNYFASRLAGFKWGWAAPACCKPLRIGLSHGKFL